jgi:hypothetical protein
MKAGGLDLFYPDRSRGVKRDLLTSPKSISAADCIAAVNLQRSLRNGDTHELPSFRSSARLHIERHRPLGL